MGVMSCNRTGCSSIMCDTYIDGVGYICNDCKEEFKDYLSSNGSANLTEREIRKRLLDFIETEKGDSFKSPPFDIDEFFQNHTK